jgi:hypothetical protein
MLIRYKMETKWKPRSKLNIWIKVETNCKLVEWEDGSYSLFIGDKQYEYIISNQQNTKLFTNHHVLYKY